MSHNYVMIRCIVFRSVIWQFSFLRFYDPENRKKTANTKETQKPGDPSPFWQKLMMATVRET